MKNNKHVKFLTLIIGLFLFCALIQGSFSIYRELKGDSIDLNILDPNTNYAITFNPNGGSIDPQDASRTKTYNQPVGTLPTPEWAGYNFIGWYTDPDDDEGDRINANTLVTGNVTYYAHWEKIICRKALDGTLHTETCDSTGSCRTKGFYSANDTITYGTVPGIYSPRVGDAYDCDVNDDGTFDPLTERFYYIREITDSSGSEPVYNSFLVHFTSFDENGQMDSSTSRGSYVYDTAINYLPTSSAWDNSGLISMNGNVTRFIDREDIKEACGSYSGGNSFETCQFFLEHSRFQSKNLGRAGIWIEKYNNTLYRIHTETLIATTAPDAESVNAARPVIEIPSYAIEGYKKKQQFHIQFEENEGSSVTDFDRYEGDALGTLETPTRTGYIFDGWYTDNNNYTTQVTENTIVTGNATYYAKWVEELTINFNANGTGASVSPTFKKVGKGRAIGELPTPTYTGREFSGWYTDPTGGTEVTSSTIMNAGTTLYAHWTGSDELPYVFYIPGECSFSSSGLTNGANGDCISTINPTGSSIDYTQSSLSSKKYIDTGVALYDATNHDRDYEIGFTIVSYSTTGQADRATLMNTKAEISTSTIKYPGVVFRRNNSTSDFLLQSRQTLSANAEYTVASSDVQNVKIYRINDEIYYSINGGAKVLLNTLESYNPEFDLNVWFGAAPTNAAASGAQRFFTGTLSNLYVKLEPDVEEFAEVTFDPNYEGAQTTSQNVIKGSAIGELDEPDARVGYTFLGWFTAPTNGTEVTSSTVVDDDVTYYAHWAENVTITLIPGQGATVSPNTVTLPSGTAVGNLLPTPEWTGHTFLGWYEESTFDTLVTSETVVTSNTNYYAKWVENVTATFIPGQDATVTPNTITVAPGSALGNLPVPEKTGYTFKGWFTDPTSGTQISSSTTINANTNYYAHWVENVTVTFNADGGIASFNSKEVEPGTSIGELPTATKANSMFDGWYDENDTSYTTLITTETIVNTDVTYKAKWVAANYVAEVNGTYYETLDAAIGAVPTTGVKTTVTLLQDVTTTAVITIANTKNVELDLGSYTITNDTTKIFINNGTLHIINGTIVSNGTEKASAYMITNESGATLNISGGTLRATGTNVIINTGTVNVTGGKLESSAQSAIINNNSGGILNVSAGEFDASGTTKGQAIYNDGGTTTISGTALLKNVSQTGSQYGRACVHNNAGTVNILGGTIISTRNAGVKNNGTMTIGTDNGTIDTTSPVIRGHNCGLETVSGKPVAIYDGIFKGGAGSNPAKAISNEAYTSHGTAVITHDTETIESVTYDVAYLVDASVNYTVTFNATANGGSINAGDPNTKTYTEVGTVGEMPSASKTGAAFLGWFTAASGGERVLTTTVVDDDVTYYAHYTSQTKVCRPATTLHSSGNTEFGQIPSGDSLSAGDAFDCDVNGDGTYDATNERFYYLTDTSNGNAVFIFANNTSQVGGNASAVCGATAIAYGSGGPTTAMGELPTTSQWTNVNIYTEPRNITNGTATLASDFTYTEKAARFATLDEIKAATSSSINGANNELASYTFLLENGKAYDSTCRSNYWLETPVSATNVYRVDASSSKKLGNVAISTGNSGVRPVIEVPYGSIDGIMNIVEFDTMSTAMRTYFDNISTWDAGQSDSNHSSFDSYMTNNLNTNKCVYFENDNRDTEVNYSSGFNVYCDQPKQYDTGVTGNVNVYEYNVSTKTRGPLATYVTANNGKLYNMIPNQVYYWESATDSSKNGYVKPLGERRIISIDNTAPNSAKYKMRNVRDLGGIKVDTNGDGTIDGTIKYGKLFRSEKIWGGDGTTVQYLNKLGIYNEMDLRADSEVVTSNEDSLHKITSNPSSSSNKVFEIIHYGIDYTNNYANYKLSRDAATRVMYEFVKAHNNGDDNYSLLFHCRIGADRTGTLAYILEGLLGAPTEERYRDYELTVFFGLRERTRYYFNKGSNEVKFQYLKSAIRNAGDGTNEDVMTWFLKDGNTATVTDEDTLQTVTVNLPTLISDFRSIMIDSY